MESIESPIKVYDAENVSEDLVELFENNKTQVGVRRTQSTEEYNKLADAYNKLHPGDYIEWRTPTRFRFPNFKRTLEGRGLDFELDYEAVEVKQNAEGYIIPVEERWVLVKKVSKAYMRQL